MEIVQQLRVELSEAKQTKEELARKLLEVSKCIDVFQKELQLRQN